MKKRTLKNQPLLDDLDQKIIQELQQNARQSYLKLGDKIGASEGTIRNRIRQILKEEIVQLKAVLNLPMLGFDFSCVMGLEVSIDCLAQAEASLSRSPNVYFLSGCTGIFDLIAILVFRDNREFDRFVKEEIVKLPGIGRIQTFVNMNVVKAPWSDTIEIAKLLENDHSKNA